MPLVQIEMRKGKSVEYKKKLLDQVHTALVEAFKIPDYDRMQKIIELDEDHFEISSNKTSDCILIQLTIFQGRSLDAKRKLYQSLVEKLEQSPGINRGDVVIVLNEVAMENWGLSGKPGSETKIGFEIKV